LGSSCLLRFDPSGFDYARRAFDIQVQSQTVSQQLLCVPLAQKILHGQITPASITQQPSEVEVTYLAMWDHCFFGIADGLVTTIPVATAIPDQNGNFEVTLPDFSAQANLGEAEFRFTLREIKIGNIIAFPQPGRRCSWPPRTEGGGFVFAAHSILINAAVAPCHQLTCAQ
jgi:hypothetical protein